MAVTAKEITDMFDEIGLNYKDRKVDDDGDHIFAFGLPADSYEDFDGESSFMLVLQLREHIAGTGEGDKSEMEDLLTKLIETDDSDELKVIKNKISALKSQKGEREYEMLASYIPRLNSRELSRNDVLEVINEVNSSIKCSTLSIDKAGDVVFNYMLIVEDAKVTLGQIKRFLSVIVSSVNKFGKVVDQKSAG